LSIDKHMYIVLISLNLKTSTIHTWVHEHIYITSVK
jgi:hypothetical protein